MTTPPLRIFSDTASTSTVDPKPLAELDFSDVDLLLEGDTPVVSIEGLESKVKQQVGQILATAATALSADWTAIYLLDDETQNLILIDQCSQSDRFQQADEIRNLKYSTADLEALTGHVVMLESSQRMEYWNAQSMPEPAFAYHLFLMISLWAHCGFPLKMNWRPLNIAVPCAR